MQQELWANVCKSIGVSEILANKWFDQIQTKYANSSVRYYHNENMLEFKVKLMTGIDEKSPHLVLAAFFQYYEYDVRNDCVQQNLDAFKAFYQESNLDSVSIVVFFC